ncbi:hypothetical protein C5167_037028 [Papaver somniferum]|uniref:HMA domain-containing protein n=1 Tax=Papaver somniferum TaxID=3469 RepID=A0A4Y7I9K4_PAPSO|nr:protein SODIUM POTASSIUM ROOT DEFECTIVE 1-like [Papaver somniferum]RZC44085.1 hypothetical protein C5167_037028 [Papaver somniferum]
MKRIDLFCASQASTAICSSMDHQSMVRSSNIVAGNSRAIDRHNPHLTDTIRRSSRQGLLNDDNNNNSINPSSSSTSTTYHPLPKNLSKSKSKTKSKPYHNKENQDKTTTSSRKSSVSSTNPITDLIFNHRKSSVTKPICDVFTPRKSSVSKSTITDLFSPRKSSVSKPIAADLFTPPGSARYLLSDSSFIDIDPISEFNPRSALVPIKSSSTKEAAATPKENLDLASPATLKTCSSTRSADQVVVLRVSLHCKGCAGKVRKHISRMEGVTSYSIDFPSKKVTVIGNVTPLSVLASVSRVKSAQFWPSSLASSKPVLVSTPK